MRSGTELSQFMRVFLPSLLVTRPLVLKSPYLTCPGHSPFRFDRIFFKLTGFHDRHKILDFFEFGPYCTIYLRVTCP